MDLLDRLEALHKTRTRPARAPASESQATQATPHRRVGRRRDPRPKKQVTLVLSVEIYDVLEALRRERQRAEPSRKVYMRDLIEEAVRGHYGLGPTQTGS